MLRAMLEQSTRRTSFRRRLPLNVGGAPLYVSGSAGLKYIFKPMDAIDPALCKLAVEFVKSGHVVWDIGANIGLFAFSAAHLAGRSGKVFAFEADTWLVQLLRRSQLIQPDTSAEIQVISVAIASDCGLRRFNIAHRSRASNFLEGYGQTQTGGVAESHTVISVSLDWLAQHMPSPDVIKIDVEGAELEVLKGAADLFKAKNPVIICEVCSETTIEVSRLLKELGYKIYDGNIPVQSRKELELAPWNTVAMPSK